MAIIDIRSFKEWLDDAIADTEIHIVNMKNDNTTDDYWFEIARVQIELKALKTAKREFERRVAR